jgi:hypothetical protein
MSYAMNIEPLLQRLDEIAAKGGRASERFVDHLTAIMDEAISEAIRNTRLGGPGGLAELGMPAVEAELSHWQSRRLISDNLTSRE